MSGQTLLTQICVTHALPSLVLSIQAANVLPRDLTHYPFSRTMRSFGFVESNVPSFIDYLLAKSHFTRVTNPYLRFPFLAKPKPSFYPYTKHPHPTLPSFSSTLVQAN